MIDCRAHDFYVRPKEQNSCHAMLGTTAGVEVFMEQINLVSAMQKLPAIEPITVGSVASSHSEDIAAYDR